MRQRTAIRYWWVNHRGAAARSGGNLVWLPERPKAARLGKKKTARAETPADAPTLQPGDLVFAHADGALRGLGLALGNPPQEEAPQGEFLVPVRFFELAIPLHPKPHMAQLSPLLPHRQSPLRATGVRNPQVHLAAISDAMALALRELLAGQIEEVEAQIKAAVGSELADDWIETSIQHRAGLSAAQKQQLIRARRGLGAFRRSLERIESACRVTGLLDRRHLRACHIKPWGASDDQEKLDGCNGLLLSPHIAELFCRGYISFSDQGVLLTSRSLNPAVLKSWQLTLPIKVGTFLARQCVFLDYHRREIFDKPGIGRKAAS